MSQRDVVKVLIGITLLYALVSQLEPPDFDVFLYPWLDHIRHRGPIGAFAEPFGNYAPPYLYLLALFSVLPIPAIAVIKLIAIVCLGWLAFAIAQLVRASGCKDPLTAAVFVLCLPTVIFNGPGLGQCDGLWVGGCLLALAAATEGRVIAAAGWAGLAFAFKAQAAFIAPLILVLVIQQRQWAALAIPPLIYLAAVVPAWAAGWPLTDLLTIYAEQARLSSPAFVGNAPNVWAIPASLGWSDTNALAYVLAGLALAASLVGLGARPLDRGTMLPAALVCAMIFPFLLPKMHERYFFLAELLAFVLAYWKRDRASIILCGILQVGTLLSIIAYLMPWPLLNAVGSLFTAAALALAVMAWRKALLNGDNANLCTTLDASPPQKIYP